MYAARAITRTLQLQRGALMSRHSTLLRQSQSRGNAAAAIVNNGLKSDINNSSTLKSSSLGNDNNNGDEAPPDFVRSGIQRMLEQAQQHSNNDNKYNGGSHSSDIENSKALQALELVQVRFTYTTYTALICVAIEKENHPVELTHWSNVFLVSFSLPLN
jgi:hypothetical protein